MLGIGQTLRGHKMSAGNGAGAVGESPCWCFHQQGLNIVIYYCYARLRRLMLANSCRIRIYVV